MKQWWEQICSFGKRRKKEQLLTAVLVVVILLRAFWPSAADHEKQEKQQTEEVQTQVQAEETNADERKKLEDDLKRILLQVEGVGEVDVAVTMESTGRKLVEKDVPLSESSVDETGNGTNSKKESKNSEEATVYLENADGTKAPYVVEETMPVVRGVLVVAQGADDPQVVAEIKEAAMALFHLEAHKIKVMKRK